MRSTANQFGKVDKMRVRISFSIRHRLFLRIIGEAPPAFDFAGAAYCIMVPLLPKRKVPPWPEASYSSFCLS